MRISIKQFILRNGGEPCDVCLEKWNSTKGEFKWTESGYLARKAVREVTQSDD
jgi:hypothetical protein